jgi:methionine-gamma-lyase
MAERKPEGYLDGKPLHPESLMMGYGYKPELSQGSVKCPIFQTSTFVFETAEEGKAFFELAYGIRQKNPGEEMGLIYSRLNNPDLEILEDRLKLWDDAEDAAVFASGMAAISTTMLAFLRPGDVVLHSEPVYGGTDYLLKQILPHYGVRTIGFQAGTSLSDAEDQLRRAGLSEKLALVYLETPANPSNALVDIAACAELARRHSGERQVLVAVDNTFLGPIWQHPLKHGADLVIYSATKFIGGHSDVIAGVCLGNQPQMTQVKLFPHHSRHDGRRPYRLAPDAQPGDPQVAHDQPDEKCPLRRQFPGRSPQSRECVLPRPPSGRRPPVRDLP